MLDLGPAFEPAANELEGLLKERDEIEAGGVPWGIGPLDDALGGIFPDDLVVFGGGTGTGKTTTALRIARAAAAAGKNPVCVFALEARKKEVAGRLVFEEFAKLVNDDRLDYLGWWRGQWKDAEKKHWAEAEKRVQEDLKRIHVVYKERGDFTTRDLGRQLESISNTAKMVIVDHLHVMDIDGAESELAMQGKTVRLLRDFVMDLKIPVVAFSQIRKRQGGERVSLVPDLDDFHGNSRIIRDCTVAVVMARDWGGERPARHLAPTFMKLAKGRVGRSDGTVARCYFDVSQGRYQTSYVLGRVGWSREDRGQSWKPMHQNSLPYWARNETRNVETQPF